MLAKLLYLYIALTAMNANDRIIVDLTSQQLIITQTPEGL